MGIAISFLSCYHCKLSLCNAHACDFFGLRPKTTPADGKHNLASLHFCLLIGIFSTFAFLIYGTVLGETIFHSKEAGQYVYLFSVLCPFMYAAQTTSSILNGFGKTKQTLYHNLLGVGIRIFFNPASYSI